MTERNWQLADAAATERMGACLAASLGASGAVITLSGELGTGKTTLVRGFLHALGYAGRVRSPTYTLIEPYELSSRQVLHCDLYRLNAAAELEYLGLRDRHPEGVLLVEWPERAQGTLPDTDLALEMAYRTEGRDLTARAVTERGALFLGGLPPAEHFI